MNTHSWLGAWPQKKLTRDAKDSDAAVVQVIFCVFCAFFGKTLFFPSARQPARQHRREGESTAAAKARPLALGLKGWSVGGEIPGRFTENRDTKKICTVRDASIGVRVSPPPGVLQRPGALEPSSGKERKIGCKKAREARKPILFCGFFASCGSFLFWVRWPGHQTEGRTTPEIPRDVPFLSVSRDSISMARISGAGRCSTGTSARATGTSRSRTGVSALCTGPCRRRAGTSAPPAGASRLATDVSALRTGPRRRCAGTGMRPTDPLKE